MKFEEAVQAMKEGKKVRLPQWANNLYYYLKDNFIITEHHDGNERVSHICLVHLNATNWEVMEEPKTLWDNRFEVRILHHCIDVIKTEDVKQAIKKFYNRFSECSLREDILDELKIQFGKELVE